jgi:hypothetical protein
MTVKIYLRAIEKDSKNLLALFDSKRNSDINSLITDVNAGDKVIWKPDCFSGIKSIRRIYSNEDKHPIFKSDARKRYLCKEFELLVPKTALEGDREKYSIECILEDNTELLVDPYLRIPPAR